VGALGPLSGKRQARKSSIPISAHLWYREMMEGVTTALVAFIFVCVVYPQTIKNRPQFYAAFAFICVIILLDGIGKMVGSPAFAAFAYAAVAVLQPVASRGKNLPATCPARSK
jgi:hypothetical protein